MGIGLKPIPAHVVDIPQPNRISSPIDPIFAPSGVLSCADRVSGAWPSANDPVAIPFFLQRTDTVRQLGWLGGTGAAAVNIDVGIYDSSWNRLVSTGATARGTASVTTWVDVADTVLVPGKYYLVASMSGTTANQINLYESGNSVLSTNFLGVFDSTTDAHPLPNPLTNMVAAATFVRVPILFIAWKAVVG